MMRLILLVAIVAVGCNSNSEQVARPLPPAASRPVDFLVDVKPIFENNCLKCHGPMKQKAGYRLDDKAVALKSEVVKPGDSANSKLIHHLVGMNGQKIMPPQPPPLTDEQIGILRAWIDQGARWVEEKR
jgi:mono/diheme cytochrome c family protein